MFPPPPLLTACLALSAASAVILPPLVSVVRRRGWTYRWAALEFWTALLVPGVGPVAVLLLLVFEAVFRRHASPARPEELQAAPSTFFRRGRSADIREEIRRRAAVEPFVEILRTGDEERAEAAIRRLLETEDPETLGKIREAFHSANREVRLCARALIARCEDRLIRTVRTAASQAERGRGFWKLALLNPDRGTARQYLERAEQSLLEDLKADPASRAGLDLGAVRVELGELEEAREALEKFVRVHPDDPEGYRRHADVCFRLGRAEDVRRDMARLRRLGRPVPDMAAEAP